MTKKVISIFLIIAVCLSFCACDTQESPPEETQQYVLPTEVIKTDISLPYTSADTLDPYSSQSSMNRDLLPIIYESLYTATKDGNGKELLAEGGELSSNVATITLKSGVKFSDGEKLTAAHVVSSYESAKSNEYFKPSLSRVSSVKATDELTVEVTFSSNEPFAFNALNFPIVKGSGKSVIGSGKYRVEYIEDNVYLQVNTYHRDYVDTWNKQIALWDMAGVAGPVYSFRTKDICIYKNDLSKEAYVNLSSKTVSQDINNFVYVGVNSAWAGSITSIDYVRQAINIGINRTKIAASSYLGQTEATVTPYRMDFDKLNYDNLPDVNGSLDKAIDILERNGYASFNDDGVRTNGVSSLKTSILVCTENPYKLTVAQEVKASLEELGFGVTITEKDTVEEFLQALSEGFFGLYIGETVMPQSYNMDAFFTEDGAAAYGIKEELFAEYTSFTEGSLNTMGFVERFETEVPFIPLFYRKAIISVSDDISGVDANNPYSSISDWVLQDE